MTKINPSPKHGSSPRSEESVSQADGTSAQDPRGTTQQDQKQQPSGVGPTGKNPGIANTNAPLRSGTPENREGAINPSAPTQSTEGPSTNLASPGNPNSDAIGEIYHPDPKGNLDMGKMSNPPATDTGHAINAGEKTGNSSADRDESERKPASRKPGKEGVGDSRKTPKDEKDGRVA